MPVGHAGLLDVPVLHHAVFRYGCCRTIPAGHTIADYVRGVLLLLLVLWPGTPHYMSPEVITHRPYTFASDMWALGVVLYEMASRRPAYDARGLPQVGVGVLGGLHVPYVKLYLALTGS